ncbi:type IIL restriction-modification enzyme MmeI [Chryseobacterium sp. MYb328]|uniref:type IIL restriction-modification enzyme MmeI n=1 Tax=Chryseobacterium sp. MYb328 TaxID=2745231 RepID=UPI00309A3868
MKQIVEIGKPMPLASNKGKSFQGSIVLGKGFVLSPEEAEKLIKKDPRNKDVLFPYLNGDDLNNDPEQRPSRWVINFFDWDEEKARTYPDCYEIIEKLVKPERQRWKRDNNDSEIIGTYALRKPLPQKWWIYGEKRPALYNAISELDQVMVIAQVSKTTAFAFTKPNKVLDAKLNVFANNSFTMFAFLQSNFHIYWAWKYSSTMKADLSYAPTQVFETFPFPEEISQDIRNEIEDLGRHYYNVRKLIMFKYKIGLTRFYNIYHSKGIQNEIDIKDKHLSFLIKYLSRVKINIETNEIVSEFSEFRKIAIKLDKLIIESYKWSDINLSHDFYELEYLPENDRIRFSVHPDARKEVLKRLLILNHHRYKEEISETSKNIKPIKKKTGSKMKENNFPKLF